MPKPVRKMQKANAAAHAAVLPKIPPELLDQLVKGPMTPESIQDASRAFKRALIERAMGAEMTHHLGYAVGEDKPAAVSNHRNGTSGKTLLTDDGPLRIDVPRDRDGAFEPKLIGKHERHFTGFRRQDHRHVRPRHDGTRDPGLPRRGRIALSAAWSTRRWGARCWPSCS